MSKLRGVREKVIRIRENNPCFTLQMIADSEGVGVSRERARQILKSANKLTRHIRRKHYCIKCGNEVLPTIYKDGLYYSKYCSKNCRSPEILVACDNCGELFKRSQRKVIYYTNKGYKNILCSRQCVGRYNAKIRGFAVHPENRKNPTVI